MNFRNKLMYLLDFKKYACCSFQQTQTIFVSGKPTQPWVLELFIQKPPVAAFPAGGTINNVNL